MKQIFTLLAAVIAALNSFAQISEGFNLESEFNNLKNSCWSLSDFTFSNQTPIAGTGSIVSGDGISARLTTPWLKVPASFSVTFSYRIISTSSNGVQKLKIILQDNTGETTIGQLNMNSGGIDSKTFQFSHPTYSGIKKITIELPSTAVVQIDGLQINVPYYYSEKCNTAPKANDDIFYPAPRMTYSDNVIKNDTETNTGEKIVNAAVVTQPTVGSVTLNADGTFTYTPPATDFNGGLITFQYRVYDDGYDPAQSNIATVYLEYPENSSTLPVKLVSFAGKTNSENAQLSWTVADNENARYFEVQRSTNGTNFTNTGIVFAASHSGPASYSFADAVKPEQEQYYRLKLWDKEGAFEYSNVILLQTNVTTTQPLKVWQPSASALGIQFNTTKAEKLQLAIVNLSGAVLHQQAVSSLGGINAQNISLPQSLKPGVYLVQMRNGQSIYSAKLLVP